MPQTNLPNLLAVVALLVTWNTNWAQDAGPSSTAPAFADAPKPSPTTQGVEIPAMAHRSTYLAQFSSLATKTWPNNRRLTIVFHGHSVPAGYFKTPEVRSFDAYPLLFHQLLAQKFGHAVISVITTAKGGENSEQGSKRFKSDVVPLKPDVVFIDYGLNDRTLSSQVARDSWISMIDDCKANGIKVILLTPTPDTKAKLSDPQDPLNQQAEQIRDLAAAYHVGLVDSLKGFEAEIADGKTLDSLMAQSNHPNRAGHEIVAQLLLRWFP